MSFKVGDRVRGKGIQDGECIEGLVGTIIDVAINPTQYSVRFDEPKSFFHDLDGLCPDHYGYWVDKENLELLTEERLTPDRFIVESTEDDYLFTRKDDFQGVPVYRKEKLNRNLCKHKGTCKDHIGNAGAQCNPVNCRGYEL